LKRLSCRSESASSGAARSQSAAPAHSSHERAVVPVEGDQDKGNREHGGHERLCLVEDREGELLAPALAPLAPQLLIARVLALAEPAADERSDAKVRDPGEGEDQQPMLELSRPEARRKPGDQHQATRLTRVDGGRVSAAPLDQIEDGE